MSTDPAWLDRTAEHVALMTRAVHAVDAAQDPDVAATIGAPLDDLADLVASMTVRGAVLELRAEGVDLNRVLAVMDASTDWSWRCRRLEALGFPRVQGVENLMRLTVTECRALVDDPDLERHDDLYVAAAEMVGDELRAALVGHVPPRVPDTVPEHWS